MQHEQAILAHHSGPPKPRALAPLRHAMYLDGVAGAIISFGLTTPEGLGIVDPQLDVPGLKLAPIDARLGKQDRWFAITPEVWEAFAATIPSTDPSIRSLVGEYWSLFLELTPPLAAPFYLQAAPEFFAWVRAAAAP